MIKPSANAMLAFCMITTSSAFADANNCFVEIRFDKKEYVACTELSAKESKDACLAKLFGGVVPQVSQHGASVTLKPREKRKACVNGIELTPSGFDFSIGYNFETNTFAASSVRAPEIGNIVVEGYSVCNIGQDGKIAGELKPEFGFIPRGAKLKFNEMRCHGLSLDASSITLASAATICGLKMPAGTMFSEYSDEHYHFTALSSGVMKVVWNESPSTLTIKKGMRYRKPRNPQQPCDWEPTPDEIFNPPPEQID